MGKKRRLWNYPRKGLGPIRRWLPSWRVVLGAFIAVVAMVGGLVGAAWATTSIPDNLDSVNDQLTTIYYDDGVTEIGTLAKEKRIKISYGDLPEYVGNAVVASEDSTFWTNSGIDPKGIVRALVNNLSGGSRQGASTLTQQYVERYYTDSTTTYAGKAKEVILAMKVSQAQSKEEILQGYLNTIYWGRGAYGIEAASKAYFGKSAKDLTISEAAMLSGIIPSPTRWDPAVNEDQAKARFDRSIKRMTEAGFITQGEAAEAAFPEYLPKPDLANSKGGQAGYLMNEVVRELTRKGGLYADNPESLETHGLKITTTIHKPFQDQAVVVADSIPHEGDGAASPNLQMALVSIDPTNGEIKTLYGGKDFVERNFNYATDGRAQGGSTFKPFTLIGALEEGVSLQQRFNGNSRAVIPGYPTEGNRGPQNFGNISYGDITLEMATANSVNSVYAALNMEIGPERTAQIAHQLGIPEAAEGSPGFIADNPANVLGTASVRPLDLTAAYATIAGAGQRITPHIVRSVAQLDDTIIYNGPTNRTPVISQGTMGCAVEAMQKVVTEGSGKPASAVKGPHGEFRPIAGKTGTSQKNVSAWFAGFTPQLVTVVGLHQDKADGTGEESITPFGQWRRSEITGGSFPVTAWADFMKVALADEPVVQFEKCVPVKPSNSPSPSMSEEPSEEPEPSPSESATQDPQAGWVTVPDGLVGKQQSDVKATLAVLGLSMNVSTQASDQPAETVLSISGVGTKVPPGSTITVVVSSGPAVAPPTEPAVPSTEPTEPATPPAP
ncbi:MAG: transglycosylase domain-containing protein [Cellulomonadaceae bacterium]|jgi:membrane peptidoglycan carboxypeptidase|nr:transglycosylase domain-containing protein [Cellulomonadaceae bacterium]